MLLPSLSLCAQNMPCPVPSCPQQEGAIHPSPAGTSHCRTQVDRAMVQSTLPLGTSPSTSSSTRNMSRPNIHQCNYPLTGTTPSTVFLAAAATGPGTTPSLPPTAATVTAALAAAAVRLALALVPVRFVM